ncbi:MAG: hypothetical protein WC595_06160 [Candidatus Nanoarchaeia archaeon]
MTATLDKARKNYHQRKERLQLPAYVLGFLSIVILLSGILLHLKTLLLIGILSLIITIYFIILGKSFHKMIFRK